MPDSEKNWEDYRSKELSMLSPILDREGFSLAPEQPHIKGERYLMSGKKLVLKGFRKSDGIKVIIKASSDPGGIAEIERERKAREVLYSLPFAYRTFLSPKEILYAKRGPFTLLVTEYIEQKRPLLAQPLEEQFFLILDAFKAQEGVHATTYAHTATVRDAFDFWKARDYLHAFSLFSAGIIKNAHNSKGLRKTLEDAEAFLKKNYDDIERYCGFLTHEDFALQNLRVTEHGIYLIDHASLRFGNKYESWARFLNYITLYNPGLERALSEYVRQNRAPEEYLSLRLMRVYKVVQLLEFHARALAHSTGNLLELSRTRITFWTEVLRSLLADAVVPEERIESYKKERDRLRSPEELARQKELQQL